MKFNKNYIKEKISNSEFVETSVVGIIFVVLCAIFLPFGLLNITQDTLYWIHSSFIQGFVAFLAIFGTFLTFKLANYRDENNKFLDGATDLIMKYRKHAMKIGKTYDTVDGLKELSKHVPELEFVCDSYIKNHDERRESTRLLKSYTRKIFLLVTGLIMISILSILLMETPFAMKIYTPSPLWSISINNILLTISVALASLILILTLDFFRDFFLQAA